MSTSTLPAAAEVIAIHLYWRSHANGRQLPVHVQAWWYSTGLSDGTWQDQAVPGSLLQDCDSPADLVAALAELHGHYIDPSMVLNNWQNRTAIWGKGA